MFKTLSRGRFWEDRVSYEYYVVSERGASVTQACRNAVVATYYVLLNLTYLHTYHCQTGHLLVVNLQNVLVIYFTPAGQ
jgi:diaminopimelate epimerase